MTIFLMVEAINSFLSAVGTGLIVLKLYRFDGLHRLCVYAVFFKFFVCICFWAISRLVLYAWILAVEGSLRVDLSVEKVFIHRNQLELLGVNAIPISTLSHNGPVTAMTVAGNVGLIGVSICMVVLTYELAKLAVKSMDRGPEREARHIQIYRYVLLTLLGVYVIAEASLAIYERGYTVVTNKLLQSTYVMHLLAVIFMIGTLGFLKVRGYQYEALHGTFVLSPVYQRLKNIITVYCVFALQYQVASLVFSTTGDRTRSLLITIGISTIMFTLIGVALALVAGCSQTCVLHMCRLCIPNDVAVQIYERDLGVHSIMIEPLGPPQIDPVFVYTDIEASSALWALAKEDVMQQAIDIHDDILRSSLLRHNGYEITTSGDSFQLAFHTIEDAVTYCAEVQLALVAAPWPKELHNLLPATKKECDILRVIYRGLRVRMGIHDTISTDGALVITRHVVTGKMTYTGASEAIAGEIGELAYGGQILATHRVAEWTQQHLEQLEVNVAVKFVCHFRMEPLASEYDVFQITPSKLIGRCKTWKPHNGHLTLQSPLVQVQANLTQSSPVVGFCTSTTSQTELTRLELQEALLPSDDNLAGLATSQ